MKSLPAIIALYIVFTTSGSNAAALHGPGVGGSYGQDTLGYRRSPWEPADDNIPNVKAQLTVDTDTQLDIYQKDGENDEVYYRRILTQHSYESSTEYSIRIEILKALLPDLPIWDKYIYYYFWSPEPNSVEPQIKESYLVTKQVRWEPIKNYFGRLFEKHDDENINEYIRRICVMRTRFPKLSVWQGNGFIEYVKPYLIAYQKDPKSTKKFNKSLNSFSDSRTQSSSSFPSIEVNSQSSSVAASSPGPSSDPTVPSLSVAPSSPNPTSNNIYQSSSVTPSSPSPTSNPTTATPTTSNLVSSQQITTTTSTISSPNTLPANSLSHRRAGKMAKYLKLKGGNYAIQEGETEERYCKRVLQTELPLPKKEYYKRAESLKKVLKSKLRKYVRKLCKPYLLLNGQQVVYVQIPTVQPVSNNQQVPTAQPAPTNPEDPTTQNAPTIQQAPSTQQVPTYVTPSARLSAGAQFTAGV